MKKINLAITGCLGRMGQQIIKSVQDERGARRVERGDSEPELLALEVRGKLGENFILALFTLAALVIINSSSQPASQPASQQKKNPT